MYVHVNADSIKVEVRCTKCDQCMYIYEQYEYNDRMVIRVDPCEECKEES